MTKSIPYGEVEATNLSATRHVQDVTRSGTNDVTDLFDVLFETDDGVDHTPLSVRTHRFSNLKMHDKDVLLISIVETLDRSTEAFTAYKDQLMKVTLHKYDTAGNTIFNRSWYAKMLSVNIAQDSFNTQNVLTYDFLFLEA